MKRKIKFFLILIFLSTFIIPSVYAFYYYNYESSILSKFKINLDSDINTAYVRATVLTYWIDAKSCDDISDYNTCNIVGKSSWNINPQVINNSWTLLEDGFYYYNYSVNQSEFNSNNISSSSIALIDDSLSFEELTDDLVPGIEIMPKYEVIYDFIEQNGVETGWNVTYQSGIPTLK